LTLGTGAGDRQWKRLAGAKNVSGRLTNMSQLIRVGVGTAHYRDQCDRRDSCGTGRLNRERAGRLRPRGPATD